MFLRRLERSLANMETKEREILKAKEKGMLLSINRERNLPVNIGQNKAMMKATVGNYIQK